MGVRRGAPPCLRVCGVRKVRLRRVPLARRRAGPGSRMPQPRPARQADEMLPSDLRQRKASAAQSRTAAWADGGIPQAPRPDQAKASNGFSSGTPKALKSATLRVTTVRRWIWAVAAIMASSNKVSDLRCINRVQALNACASIGSTL